MNYYTSMDSPVGKLLLVADDAALSAIHFDGGREAWEGARGARERAAHPILRAAAAQLDGYFNRRRQVFDLPLAPTGTPFQRQVWRALEAIPYGQTRSYGDVARQIDNPRATQAVGAANGANPLPIVVPCHRVIGRDGSLTGYGGGMTRKRRLLALEHNPEVAQAPACGGSGTKASRQNNFANFLP